jgi:ribosomal protein S18 acetylase RimI-like enzyme
VSRPSTEAPGRDGARALAFLRELYLRRADRVEERDWGLLAVTPSLPKVWDANLAILERWEGGPAELHRRLDEDQAALGLAHRKTTILDEALAGRVWPALAEPDWPLRGRYLVMAQRRAPDRLPDPATRVEEVGLEAFRSVQREVAREEPWGSDEEVLRQLDGLAARVAETVRTRPLAALAGGEPVSSACLYVEGPVAQVEDVGTLPAARGRGYARAVVWRAVEEARRAGAELVFLVADEDDWPKELYRSLGFETVAVEHLAGRADAAQA